MTFLITVIVLSYNGTADTLACLDSLQERGERSFDILVVDNGSTDGAPATIRARYPDIDLLELAENRGWAGGNNVGIEVAISRGSELICLLNNDTIASTDAVRALADATRRHAPCLMHPAIDYADLKEGPQLDPGRLVPKAFRCLDDDPEVFELDFAYGACLMIPTKVFRNIGMFDERFFLQLEETDFWLRAQRFGIRSLCTTKARIIHAESRSFGGRRTPLKTYYIVRNRLLLTEKHHRTVRGVLGALRSLYWSVSQDVKEADGRKKSTSPAAWLVSRNPHVRAARAGLRDYLFRRFGRINSASLHAINH
jgi:GT2 family glycosyltransferase